MLTEEEDDLCLDAGEAVAPPVAPGGRSCLPAAPAAAGTAAGSEEGWTGLPGMVSPHARSSRSSSPPPGGEEDEGCSAEAAPPRLPPAPPVTGVPDGVGVDFF